MIQSTAEASPRRTLGGRYALHGLLGVGGMGAVYEAVHVVTGRRVAVKILHQSMVQAVPNIEARFSREAQASASIDHPGIVDVLDAGRDEETGDLFLVLELLTGEDLDHALAANRLSAAEILDIILEVLDPLAAAHAKGFVHRDIKPANIFLCATSSGPKVKLLDFGIVKAQRQAEITANGALIGTIDYMSPEQMRGVPVGPETDLWAIAATLFHALAGRPPFVAETRLELMNKIGAGRAPSVSQLWPAAPPALVAVVDRGLSPDPAARYHDARSLQDALRYARTLSTTGAARHEQTELVRPDLFDAAPTARAEAPNPSPALPSVREDKTAGIPGPSPAATYPSTALHSPAQARPRPVWIFLAALTLGLGGWWAMTRTSARPKATTVLPSTPPREVATPPRAASTPISKPTPASPTPTLVPPTPTNIEGQVVAPPPQTPSRPRRHRAVRARPAPLLDPPAPTTAPAKVTRSPEEPLRRYE